MSSSHKPAAPPTPSGRSRPSRYVLPVLAVAGPVDGCLSSPPSTSGGVSLPPSPRRKGTATDGFLGSSSKRLTSPAGGIGQSGTCNLMMQSSQSQRGPRTDIVASGNAMVAEVTAFLTQRARQRNTDTMRYLELRAQMKPPPPMTMDELEQHPLTKHKAKKNAKQDRDLDMHDDDGDSTASHIPFIAKEVAGGDVMHALRLHIADTARELHLSKKPHVALSRAGIVLPPTPSSSQSARPWRTASRESKRQKTDWDDEGVDWAGGTNTSSRHRVGSSSPPSRSAGRGGSTFLTEAPTTAVAVVATPNTPGLLPAPPRTANGGMVITTPSASPLSVRALGPEHDKAILSRDPNELRKIRNDDRYSQTYRKPALGDAEQLPAAGAGGGGGGGHSGGATSDRVAMFHDQLRFHTHSFHQASISELERVRAAMHLFHPLKVDELQKALDDDSMLFSTAVEVFGRARGATIAAAKKKDNAERLDVFFDHLERLDRYMRPSIPAYGQTYIDTCLAEARALVERKEGMQTSEDFAQLVKATMPQEFLLHYVVADFLRMLAAIFGIGVQRFRFWLREQLSRFEERDYEPVFRKVEVAIGKEVSTEARCRLTLNMVRGCVASAVKLEMALRVQVERSNVMTSAVSGGAKATWKESFVLHMYDESSPLTVHLLVNGNVEGSGAFSIFRYPVGKISTMWLPIPGETIPHAEVNVSVEVLPVV